MSRSIRARLDRLERQHLKSDTDVDKVPPQYWAAICGAVPLEQLDPDTRRFLARVFEDSRKEPDQHKESEGATTS
ncbi:MAG TPA: hypothetical protein VGP76_03890 [Planctomycetaceae bacterium]|jgi:hypothetical protein|nr:hypothetical protein [Planctomycetaceae bacterium]